MKIEILTKDDEAVRGWIYETEAKVSPAAVGILFGGDRWNCVEEVICARDGEEFAGIVTIAPEGEQRSAEPTIVGLYVLPKFRRRTIGKILLETAIDHMLSEGLEPIRLDVLSRSALRIIERLPAEKRQKLKIVDCSQFDMGTLN